MRALLFIFSVFLCRAGGTGPADPATAGPKIQALNFYKTETHNQY